MTLWEIATLQSLGRIRLHLSLPKWFEQALRTPYLERIRISPAIAAEVAALPDSLHRDPADRVLIATARVLEVPLLTRDRRILESKLVATL